MNFCNELECLSLESLSSLVLVIAGKARAYPSDAFFSCSTLGYAPGLTHKHQTRVERLARVKHSSVLRKFINYGPKKFYRIGSSAMKLFYGRKKNYRKGLYCQNLPEYMPILAQKCRRGFCGLYCKHLPRYMPTLVQSYR